MSRMASSKDPTNLRDLLSLSPALRSQPGRIGQHQWRLAVGDRVAARSSPGKLVEGLLTVVVSSSTWAQELSLLSTTIVERLQAEGLRVRRLRFVVGRVEPLAQEPAPARVSRRELPRQLRARLERIDDPELRAAIAEAASYRPPKP